LATGGHDMSKTELKTVNSQVITPIDIINSGQELSVEKMQQLMDMQFKWEENEAKKAYVNAMSEFRSKCPSIDRTKSAYNSNYAGLAETIEQIKSLLSKYGLSHSWKTDQEGNQVKVTCIVTHSQGHSESTSLMAEPDNSGSKNKIQAMASTVSYLERYTLFAILGLASKEMDTDGNIDPKLITPEQAKTLNALIKEVGANEKGFLQYLGVSCLENLQATNFDAAVNALNQKRKSK